MKKTKGKLDPLEENKVGGAKSNKTGGKKRSTSKKAAEPLPDPPRPGEPPATESIQEAEAEAAPSPKPERKPVPMVPEKPVPSSDLPPSESGKYEVLESKSVSIRGHITSMPAGTVIHLAHYGRQVMIALVKQGLKLKGVD